MTEKSAQSTILDNVKTPLINHKTKFRYERTDSDNNIQPVYHYRSEQFSNNYEFYDEGTRWLGIFLAFISGIFFTISSALVKGTTDIDPMILLCIRGIIQTVVMFITACILSKNPIGTKDKKLLIQFQGIVGGMTLSLMYYSFRMLPLGDATTIIFSSPVLVIFLSFIFLKEPCGVLRITVMCTLLVGVVLIARPPFLFHMHTKQSYDLVGYISALLATLFTALNIVVMRKCSEVHYSVIVFNMSLWSFISSVIFFTCVPMYHTKNDFHDRLNFPNDWFSWEIIIMITITGLAGQILVANALKIEGAGKVSVTRSLDVILAYLIQIYFFDEIPSKTSIIGAILIVFSVICMGFEREIYGICDFIP